MKSFAGPAPEQAARVFANIQFLLEPPLSQYVGMTAVPWQAALDGVAVIPRDLDLVVADADAVTVGAGLAGGLIEPVCPAGWPISKWWAAIRVPPLHLQRAVSARRGMADRVALIDSLGYEGCNPQ
ncbi:MAG TPA: hypothetical protein VKG80_02865 [Trebonia sp.]|nr:hypothetical protein [Trebonia sp.]